MSYILTAYECSAQSARPWSTLKKQVGCTSPLNPVSVIIALRKDKVIAKAPYIVSDSQNYFRVKGKRYLFGWRVRSVIGFARSNIFTAGPGMQPPPLIGIVVYARSSTVKKYFSSHSKNLFIEEAADESGPPSLRRTEIVCYDWPKE